MGTGPLPRDTSLIGDDAIEPIGAVFARLSGNVEELSLAGCERWFVDAQRMAGWLAVTRLRVEQVEWEHRLAMWATPEPDEHDPAGDGAWCAGAGDPGSGSDVDAVAEPTASPEANADAGAGEAEQSPVDAPGRTSRRQQARDRKLGRALALLPSLHRKVELGELTEDHVVAVDAIRNRDAARAEETAILAAAMARTAEDFAAWLCSWDARVDLDRHGDLTARQKAARKLQLFDRSNDFRGTLAPADFDAFKRTLQAIDAELQRRRDPDERLSWDQRMADALVEMMHRARGTEKASGDASLRTAVVVLIDLHDLLAGTGHGTTADGSLVDVGEVRRLAATEHIIPVVLGADSVVLDMGRARRYADDTQWLALLARDGGCVLCDAPLGTLDAHHHPH